VDSVETIKLLNSGIVNSKIYKSPGKQNFEISNRFPSTTELKQG
jgi:hypothetical protein